MHAKARWMQPRHLPEILRIERACFESPWDEEDFYWYLRRKSVVGMIVEIDDQIVGYMVYSKSKSRIELHNIAVEPTHRREGIGKMLIDKPLSKLRTVEAVVRETNLAAQLFLRSMGFKAVTVLRKHHGEEDAYLMTCRTGYQLVNRISQFSKVEQ